jgi:hypothetical protein
MGVATQEQVDALINVGGRRLTDKEYAAAVEETMGKGLNSMLTRLGSDLVIELERLIPVASGKLQSGVKVIGVKETKNGYRLEIGFGEDYSDFVDKGVRGIKSHRKKAYKNAEGKYYQFKKFGMPPKALQGLKQWAKIKNIEYKAEAEVKNSNNQGKKKRVNKISNIDYTANQLAYYIKKNGIAGRNFKKRSLDEVMPKYQVELDEIGLNSLILKITR